jgi:hypothetical protein
MTTETLQTLTLPVPPMLEAALGYPGTARYVALYWIPAGDELMWDEGWRSTVGAWQGWRVFTRHPKVAPALVPYDFGDSETPATHWFLLDRETRTCAVGTARAVQRALRTGNPAPVAPPWLQLAPGDPCSRSQRPPGRPCSQAFGRSRSPSRRTRSISSWQRTPACWTR